LEMTAPTPHRPGIAGCVLLMLGFVLLAPVGSLAAATPIYKCFDKNLGLLYTDEPCRDGELLNIRSGDADPVAVARLERARDALDRSAAQRIADQRRAAAQQDLAAWFARQNERSAYDYTAENSPYDYGVTGWFPGFARPHPPGSRPPKPLEPRRFALNPPHMMPPR
jgi:hypothetical protein